MGRGARRSERARSRRAPSLSPSFPAQAGLAPAFSLQGVPPPPGTPHPEMRPWTAGSSKGVSGSGAAAQSRLKGGKALAGRRGESEGRRQARPQNHPQPHFACARRLKRRRPAGDGSRDQQKRVGEGRRERNPIPDSGARLSGAALPNALGGEKSLGKHLGLLRWDPPARSGLTLASVKTSLSPKATLLPLLPFAE